MIWFLMPILAHAAIDPISDAEDRRLSSAPALIEAAKTPQLRERVAVALGRIQDPASADTLISLSQDKKSEVRAAAAFALGQLGWNPDLAAEKIISRLNAMSSDHNPNVRVRAVEALGKLGLEKTPELMHPFLHGKDAKVRAAAVLGLMRARMMLKQRSIEPGISAGTLQSVIHLAADKDRSVRGAVAYFFARNPDSRSEKVCAELSKDSDPWTRMNALTALQKMKALNSKNAIVTALKDPVYNVRIAAIEALAASGKPLSVHDFLMQDPSNQVRAAYARGLDSTELLEKLLKDANSMVRAEALKALFKKKSDRAWLEPYRRDPVWQVREAAVQASESLPAVEREKFLLPMLNDKDVNVRAAALEGLLSLSGSDALFKKSLESNLLYERGVAVGSAKNHMDLPLIAKTYSASLTPRWEEVREDILGLLRKDTSEESTHILQTALKDPDRSLRAIARRALNERGIKTTPGDDPPLTFSPYREQELQQNPRVLFHTNKGDFTVECFAREAPIHVADFIGHVRMKFYNGLSWHRVVPNFVVQGGDPDGTGYGGAGYFLRAEINTAPFQRGVLGMPRAQGFDTGGGQLFFTLAPAPHLDGQYTAFGRVIRGAEVLDQLERQDKIISVTQIQDQH